VRALIAGGGIALLITLFTTPAWIWLFKKLNWGQFVRDDGPETHHTKRGTPTMGGLVIIAGAVIGYFAGKLLNGETPSVTALLVLFMMVVLAWLALLTIC